MKILISIIVAAILSAFSLGTAYLYTEKPEVFNNIIKIAAYTPDQAYKNNKATSDENIIFKLFNGKAIPITIERKEDIAKLNKLESFVFKDESEKNKLIDRINDYFEAKDQSGTDFMHMDADIDSFDKNEKSLDAAPFFISHITNGKKLCILIGSENSFINYRLMGQCTINFDDFSKKYDLTSFSKAIDDYKAFYNDRFDSFDAMKNIVLPYLYNIYIDSYVAFEISTNNSEVVEEWYKSKFKNSKKPHYDFMGFTSPFVKEVYDQVLSGNISRTAGFDRVFEAVYKEIIPTVISEYDLFGLLVLQKEIYERSNYARTYHLDKKAVRQFIELGN